ncbi:MAG: choice-of-anchor L domain-containing protein [Bacteroidota bacterium]
MLPFQELYRSKKSTLSKLLACRSGWVLACWVLSWPVLAQLEIINEPPYDPDNLIETVFVGEGIGLLGVNYQGDDRSAAYFKGGLPFIGLDRGIVMSTGFTTDDNNPNIGVAANGSNQSGSNANSPLLDDPDIRTIVGPNAVVHDVTSYTITFQPISDSVSFRYVFASEEYPEFVCSQFNDIFGFFISGPGINGPYSNGAINIAEVPGSDLPVRINSVNPGTPGTSAAGGDCSDPESSLGFSNFFIDNNGSNSPPIYDGFTQVFNASASLQACETYTIKLVIADIGDSNFDSGVFLEARSFSGEGTNLDIVDLSIDGTLIEGCGSAALHFFTPEPVETDLDLEVSFFGDATAGTDYNMPPMDLTIPAGDSLLIVPVTATADAFNDDGEEILISLRRSACRVDTFRIRIEGNNLESLDLPNDVLICNDNTVDLSATIVGPEPTIYSFSQDQDVNLTFLGGWRESTIDVSGVIPEILSEETFESICIDELAHNRPAQIDAFLISPTGIPIELTTDNGGNGGNAPFQGYLGTCFRPDAVTRIALPGQQAPNTLAPFTGDWLPEGELSDLWFGSQPANGTWTLRVRDDAAFTNGELRRWSINFIRPYELNYEWSSPIASIDCIDCPEPTATVFGEGEITLRVTDSYGCELEESMNVTFEDTPSFAPPTCDLVTDSTILVNWGDSPDALFFEVSFDGINWTNVGSDTEFSLDNLDFDQDYQIFVRGQFANCPGPAFPLSCTTLPCIPPTFETDVTTTCAGQAAATVTILPQTGRAPFSFFMDGVMDADGFFDNLTPGDYTFTIVDNRGCSDSIDLQITDPPAFSGDLMEVASISCGGEENGSLAALPIGGVGPFTYSWNGATGDSLQTGLPAGDYQLIIIDANGCSSTIDYELIEPTALSGNTFSTNQNCDGMANGTASVSVEGGSPGYSYAWNVAGIGDNATATGLEAGDYQVTVTDQESCSQIFDISVGLEPAVDISVESTDILCFGQNQGSIDVSVNVGVGLLTYDWDGPIAATGSSPSNLPAGVYELTVTDSRGCAASSIINLVEPTELSGTAEIDNVACSGADGGAIDFIPQGGTLPYSFSWSNTEETEDIDQLSSGNYSVVVTDGNGCTFSEDFFVAEEPAMEVGFNVEPTDCPGDATGSVSIALTNGTGPYTYNWSNGSAASDLTNVTAGSYQLEITDANGCIINSEVVVPGPLPFVFETVVEDVRCFGTTDGLIEIDLSGGNPPYEFSLNGGSWQAPNSFIGLGFGRYNVEVRDRNGCGLTISGLSINEPDPLEISLGPDQQLEWGDSVWLSPLISGGTPPVRQYDWSPEDSTLLSCLDCEETWASPVEQTTIRLRVFDAMGCFADDIVTLLVDKSFPVMVPTGFTPNGDRRNDLLLVHGRPGIEVVSFQIFDRWGEEVYTRENFMVNDPDDGWDGSYRGQPLNAGVYIWQLTALRPDGEEQSLSGQTTLIR